MDKVIIDGVDVEECKNYHKAWCLLSETSYGNVTEFCAEHTNCEYKQLKRLEQENERLKEELLCESVKGRYVYSFTDQYEINRIGYLERENKKLVNDLNEFGNLNYKYKQALKEIREICKNSYTSASEDYYRTADKIQDKINEVIGAEQIG